MSGEKKATNPKDAVGTAKVPFSTVPARVVAELGLAMLEGARRYGRHNYRVAGVRGSVYYDAALRHLAAWWEGEDIDPGSGLPHTVKAMACLAVLRDSQHQGNWTDDRPPKTPPGWVEELNAQAAELIAKYPDAVPAHTAEDGADEEDLPRASKPCAVHPLTTASGICVICGWEIRRATVPGGLYEPVKPDPTFGWGVP